MMGKNLVYYNIHNIIKIKSELKTDIPSYFEVSETADIDIEIKQQKKIDKEILTTQLSPGLFISEKNTITTKFNFFGFLISTQLCNLFGEKISIAFSRASMLFSRFINIPVSTYFPYDMFIQMLIHVRLLIKQYTFLIGAAYRTNNSKKAILLIGMGGTGKTSLVLEKMKDDSYTFISDDMVILGPDNTIYGYPKNIRVRKTQNNLFNIEKYQSPLKLFGKNRILKQSKIGAIIILEKNKIHDEYNLLDKAASFNKILAINRKLLPYYMDRNIISSTYGSKKYNIQKILSIEADLISSFVEKTDVYVIKYKSYEYLHHSIGEIEKNV